VTDAVSAHYTPSHVVDLMLDRVLPWESEEWDQRILDPSCGSGIFLVKAYQRLIHRWKRANPARDGSLSEVSSSILRQILENNLVGVDKHPNAIRVASFSLYLAMCDEIDPRHYWSDEDHVSFPALREETLFCADFFQEDQRGFRTVEEDRQYDLVIGNPPWGDTTLSEPASNWAKAQGWQVANKDFGVLFIVKAMELTRPNGFVCMVQSASALLYNREKTAQALQRRIFNEWKKVDCVVNLAVFRELKLFKGAKGASCVLSLQNIEPNGEPFWYECPKPFYNREDKSRITVDLDEMHEVYPDELISEPWIWSALMWGGTRDRALLRKTKLNPCLETLMDAKQVVNREGLVRGDQQREQTELLGRRIFESIDFPQERGLFLKAELLSTNTNPFVHSRESAQLEAFELPQLIIKKSWLKRKKRFQARLISTSEQKGVICSQSYDSVHSTQLKSHILDTACLVYNSMWANYFLFLTSGSFAFERPKPLSIELRSLPLPLDESNNLKAASAVEFRELLNADIKGEAVSVEAIDEAVYRAFEFQEAERILIEDLIDHPLAEFKWREEAPNRRHTHRKSPNTIVVLDEPDLHLYSETLVRTLARTYGADKAVGIRIWSDLSSDSQPQLPMRYISIVFGSASRRGTSVELLEKRELRDRILALYRHLEKMQQDDGYGRQVREYTDFEENGEKVLVLNLLKPDWLRYWTRSAALRDADEIARDFWVWQEGSGVSTVAASPIASNI
jgi:hypothetical protein